MFTLPKIGVNTPLKSSKPPAGLAGINNNKKTTKRKHQLTMALCLDNVLV
jgi:hypothetical protein